MATETVMTPEQALAWLAELFQEPVEVVRATTAREELPSWDSMGVLTLMADLDEKFDIRVTEDEMTGMTCIQDILDLLARNGKLAA